MSRNRIAYVFKLAVLLAALSCGPVSAHVKAPAVSSSTTIVQADQESPPAPRRGQFIFTIFGKTVEFTLDVGTLGLIVILTLAGLLLIATLLAVIARRRAMQVRAANRKLQEEITQRELAEDEVNKLNSVLELRVAERTARLRDVNKELEAFSYSVSHDLRAPLRHIDAYSQAVIEDYSDKLDETGKRYLQQVRRASQTMARLIDDMLQLARVTRSELRRESVNLSEVAQSVMDDLQERDPDRAVALNIEEGLLTRGDKRLLHIMLNNLLGNAWKFTSKREKAEITFGCGRQEEQAVYFVRDNGAGFDMAYADKLFGAFQRLHGVEEFEGTGIGLATVQRVLRRHGGRVWAEGAVKKGAVFYFNLPELEGGQDERQSDSAGGG